MTGRWTHALGATIVALTLTMSACSVHQPGASMPPVTPAPSTSSPTRAPASPSAPSASPTTHTETIEDYVRTTASQRTFFAHQSVGYDVLKGLNNLSRANGWGNPPYVNLDKDEVVADGPGGGLIARAKIGKVRDPLSKIKEFDKWLRGDLAGRVTVATLMFAPTDVTAGTDIRAVFDEYRSVLAELKRDFPKVALIPATVPLTTNDAAANTARAKLNKLLRKEYAGSGHLWDVAAVESTDPDGKRVGGKKYEALFPGYAVKTANLNQAGGEAVATDLLRAIAHAVWDEA